VYAEHIDSDGHTPFAALPVLMIAFINPEKRLSGQDTIDLSFVEYPAGKHAYYLFANRTTYVGRIGKIGGVYVFD